MTISSKIKKVISAIAVSASAILYSCAPATAHAEFLSAEKWLFYARSPSELEKSIALGYRTSARILRLQSGEVQ